jgi:hypothetical protein
MSFAASASLSPSFSLSLSLSLSISLYVYLNQPTRLIWRLLDCSRTEQIRLFMLHFHSFLFLHLFPAAARTVEQRQVTSICSPVLVSPPLLDTFESVADSFSVSFRLWSRCITIVPFFMYFCILSLISRRCLRHHFRLSLFQTSLLIFHTTNPRPLFLSLLFNPFRFVRFNATKHFRFIYCSKLFVVSSVNFCQCSSPFFMNNIIHCLALTPPPSPSPPRT